MDISFIIPAYNEEKNIGRCLLSIKKAMEQHSLTYEIIVCDHTSSDATPSIAQNHHANLVQVPRGGNVSFVRNQGAKIASGKTYIFLDADIEVTTEWSSKITTVIESLSDSPLQIIGSLCLPPKEDNYLIQHWFNHTTQRNSSYLGTAHLMTSQECFNRLNGFTESLITGEDYDFCSRCRNIGGTIVIRPELVVYHYDYPRDISTFIARESWHGEGDFQSFHHIVKSKVALLTLLFIFLHLVLVASITTPKHLAVMLIIILLFIIGSTFLKFKSLSIINVIKSSPIMYWYFLGRSFSLFKVLKKHWRRQSEEVRYES